MKRWLPGILFAAILCAAAMLCGAVTPEELKARSAEAVTEKFPNADSVLLYDFEHVVYQADGTAVQTDDFYQKVLTDAGRRQLREFSFHFNTNYEELEVPVLEVIKPDGKTVKIDVAANGRVAVEPSQMGSNIYDPANKLLSVAVPDLEIGDIVHVVSKETLKKPRIPGVWSDIFVLQSDVPFLHYEVKVDAPESHPLRAIRIKDEVKGTIQSSETKKDGRILYFWTATNVPQIVPEPDMPPMYMCVQRLLVSTAKDWPEISEWYYKVSRPRLDAVTPELRAKVAELTKDARTDDAKIMALFQFVSQQIRYMGITAETEAPGYEPHGESTGLFDRRALGPCEKIPKRYSHQQRLYRFCRKRSHFAAFAGCISQRCGSRRTSGRGKTSRRHVTLCKEVSDVIANCDFLSAHLPLNDQTRNFIGRKELAAMKQGSYLINTARGSIVDEEALYDALKSGHLSGAAMNNFYFTLHQLRSYLGRKDAVLYKRGLCSLNDAVVSVDSVLFSRLIRSGRKSLAAGNQSMAEQCFEQGIKLYRGPILEGDDLPDDALIQRETLEHDAFTAMRDYGIVCIEQNHLDKAEQILSRAVRSSFSDERAYRLLIKTQYLSGNKSSSLATYEKLSLQLHTELGVEPHHLTKSLVDRIRLNLDLSSFAE